MKKRNLYRIVIGAILIISGIVPIMTGAGDSPAGTILIAAGFAFLLTGIFRHRKYGDEPESDERSKRIGAYGLSYAWLTGLIFMSGLFWLDYTGILVLGTQNALASSVLVLALSAVVFQAYMFRKGDIE